jgi:hypothetical protein
MIREFDAESSSAQTAPSATQPPSREILHGIRQKSACIGPNSHVVGHSGAPSPQIDCMLVSAASTLAKFEVSESEQRDAVAFVQSLNSDNVERASDCQVDFSMTAYQFHGTDPCFT